MSAVAAFCSPDGGLAIASDGASYDADGNLLGAVHKLLSLPRGDGYFAHVGIGALGRFLSQQLESADQDFDGIIPSIGSMARRAYRLALEEWPSWVIDPPGGTVVVGGWSKLRTATELYRFGVKPKEVIDQQTGLSEVIDAFTLSPIIGTWASTMPPPEQAARFGIDWSNEQPVLDQLVRIICANRASSRGGERGDHDGVYGVGCFLEMAVIVGADINRRWTVHEWPDQVGEPVDPAVGEPMPPLPIVIPD